MPREQQDGGFGIQRGDGGGRDCSMHCLLCIPRWRSEKACGVSGLPAASSHRSRMVQMQEAAALWAHARTGAKRGAWPSGHRMAAASGLRITRGLSKSGWARIQYGVNRALAAAACEMTCWRHAALRRRTRGQVEPAAERRCTTLAKRWRQGWSVPGRRKRWRHLERAASK